MHVGDLDGTKLSMFNSWTAQVTITVHDQNHTPLSSVTVSGNWSNGGTSSCTTGTNGTCQVTKSRIPNTTTIVTFSISSLSKSGYTYTSGSNHDPESDSNGTSITIIK
jgi:hypothetical protein